MYVIAEQGFGDVDLDELTSQGPTNQAECLLVSPIESTSVWAQIGVPQRGSGEGKRVRPASTITNASILDPNFIRTRIIIPKNCIEKDRKYRIYFFF